MTLLISRIEISHEQDVVYARQRTRLIADLIGFDRTNQTRLSTAVSEVVRNAFQYAGGGQVIFAVDGTPQLLTITVSDRGPGIANVNAILDGAYISSTGLGLGLVGVRRLMDFFRLDTEPGQGTSVYFGKILPASAPPVTPTVLASIVQALTAPQTDPSPLEEIRLQNRELLAALEQISRRDEELTNVNRELTDTNTGMIALYTELENNSERLQESRALLQARNEELKEFAYTVSHDLKAPLRGIAGYADELTHKHRTGLSERALFCLSQILTATHNLDNLIEDLLHYSRLDTETPSYTQVNVPGLIEAILRDRNLVITEQGVEVSVNIPFTFQESWERGLVQILTNLIDNALKYSRGATPPHLTICGAALAEGWQVRVSDNGIGFDMKYHDRIFGLFNRLVRQEEFEGTGAGLAIVQKVTNKLGGRIWAQSAPGQGATFFIEFPIPPGKMSTHESANNSA